MSIYKQRSESKGRERERGKTLQKDEQAKRRAARHLQELARDEQRAHGASGDHVGLGAARVRRGVADERAGPAVAHHALVAPVGGSRVRGGGVGVRVGVRVDKGVRVEVADDRQTEGKDSWKRTVRKGQLEEDS